MCALFPLFTSIDSLSMRAMFIVLHYNYPVGQDTLRIYASTNYLYSSTYNFYARGYNAKRRDWRGFYSFYEIYVAACVCEGLHTILHVRLPYRAPLVSFALQSL